jgi:hypothetical protein
MIADDRDAIRKAMDSLDWRKKVDEAEVRLRASKQPSNDLPKSKPLFDESGPPYRGLSFEGLESPINGYKEIT